MYVVFATTKEFGENINSYKTQKAKEWLIMNFHERKQARKEYYEKWIKGWKLRPCGACNGSGYYDHNDNPECGACDGTGKERYNSKEED